MRIYLSDGVAWDVSILGFSGTISNIAVPEPADGAWQDCGAVVLQRACHGRASQGDRWRGRSHGGWWESRLAL